MTRLVTASNEVGRSYRRQKRQGQEKKKKTRTRLCSPTLGQRMDKCHFPR